MPKSGLRGVTAAGLATGLALSAGAAVAAAASDRATPTQNERKKSDKTGLKLAVTPAEVVIFVDGRERGKAGELSFIALDPGTHTVRLVRGGDEFEAEIPLKRGQIVEFRYEFE